MDTAIYYVRIDFPHNGWEVFYFSALEEVSEFVEGVLRVTPKVKYEAGVLSGE